MANCTVGVFTVDVGAVFYATVSVSIVGVGSGMISVVAGRSDIVGVIGAVLLLARSTLYPLSTLSLVS